MRARNQKKPQALNNEVKSPLPFPEFISSTDHSGLSDAKTTEPLLLTIHQLCQLESALTVGGIRHLLFTKGHNIPGVYRFGRKLLFDRAEFVQGIKKGATAKIGGGSAS
ncbi:hypothetical protein [Marinobacter sp. F4216]|uniref:hypothetical protein n=1 Tax=Marinobacter sp. F4216 TaxID=2874281 RepID=UPI001CBB01C4|nr:hypothetical protein [Marinobacter sp. F4216]MBZ2168911.1 hypothetical protein [Marinobacter sp. F4216]